MAKHEHEWRLIGAILDAGTTADAVDVVTPQSFANPQCRAIFTAAHDVESSGGKITVESVAERMGGDIGANVELLDGVWNPGGTAAHYAKSLSGLAKRRTVYSIGGKLKTLAKEPGDITEELDSLLSSLADASRDDLGKEVVGVGQEMVEAVRVAQTPSGPCSLKTGFRELDNIIGGMRGGQMITLAARPGVGKSALSMNIAANVIEKRGVLVFNMEMSAQELTYRVIASESGCDAARLIRGAMTPNEWADILECCNRVQEKFKRLRIVDRSSITPSVMRSAMRRESMRGDIGLVVIDYLQLMASGMKRETQNVEVSQVSRAIKNLARDFDVPVLALSQLSRDIERRTDPRPKLSDLRDSGSIEQDSDLVMFLHRESPEMVRLIVEKQRNGPTGSCELKWNGKSVKFS